MRKVPELLAMLALALPGLGAAQADGPGGPEAPAQPAANQLTVLAEVVGTVKAIDRGTHRLEVQSGKEVVAVTLDRNTMVYTPRGLGTVLDIEPGAEVRIGRNAKFLAYWVQVRPPGTPETPVSTPAQGSSPTTGAGAPAEGGDVAPPTGAGPGGGSTTAPGSMPGDGTR